MKSGVALSLAHLSLRPMILRPLTDDFDDPEFGRRRRWAMIAASIAGIALGITHGVVAGRQLLAVEEGIPNVKIFVATVIGATSGLALWAVVACLTVSFAPEGWLRVSPKGRQWMRFSGLRLDNTTAMRVIALNIGLLAAAYTIFNLVSILLSLR